MSAPASAGVWEECANGRRRAQQVRECLPECVVSAPMAGGMRNECTSVEQCEPKGIIDVLEISMDCQIAHNEPAPISSVRKLQCECPTTPAPPHHQLPLIVYSGPPRLHLVGYSSSGSAGRCGSFIKLR